MDIFNFLRNSLAFHTPICSVLNVVKICFSVNPLTFLYKHMSLQRLLPAQSLEELHSFDFDVHLKGALEGVAQGECLQELHSDCAE